MKLSNNTLPRADEWRPMRLVSTCVKRSPVALAALLVTWFGLSELALADRVDGRIEATVQLKALSYDRAFKKRNTRTKVTIGVLYKAGGESEKVSKEMVAAFREMSKQIKVQDLAVEAVPVLFNPDSLAADLASAAVNVVYITPGLETEMSKIHAAALARKAPTLCSDRNLVKQGVAIGVFLNKTKTGIAVNVKIARELGMDLDSSLFTVAEVFK
jgi:hypothetical protein